MVFGARTLPAGAENGSIRKKKRGKKGESYISTVQAAALRAWQPVPHSREVQNFAALLFRTKSTRSIS